MNEKSVELFQSSLEVFSDEIAPGYAQVRAELIGELSITGSGIDSMRERDRNETANCRLIYDFAKNLPPVTEKVDIGTSSFEVGARYLEGEFITGDPMETQTILHETIWIKRKSMRRDRIPYYVAGHDSSSQQLLLAAPALIRQESAYDVSPHHNEINRIRPRNSLLLYTPTRADAYKYSPYAPLADKVSAAVIEEMFDRDDHMLHVTARTPGATTFATSTVRANLTPIDRLSDEQVAEFGVVDHLNNMAVLFGKENQLSALLHEHGNDARPNQLP